MIRAVVDTNVLVSGLISASGYPREIERRWRKDEFALVISPEIIDEVSRVLRLPRIHQKYRLADSDIQAFILALLYTMASPLPGDSFWKALRPIPTMTKSYPTL